MNPIFYRPAKLRGLAFLGLLLIAASILGGMIWRTNQHFETVLSYVDYSHRIQKVSVGLQQYLLGHLLEDPQQPTISLNETLTEIDDLIMDSPYLSDDTRSSLTIVRAMLADIGKLTGEEKNTHLTATLKIMSETLDHEALYREQLLEDINLDTQNELYLALMTFSIILLGAMLFLHFRILHPLHDLRRLLERLTEENFTPITTDHLDPLLLPVFNSYNEMVTHLAELEETKSLYTQSLQCEVRIATQALLEQQASLARAERLAAIGEVAAELAHEIRNPLAGILMAFNNLRREIDNPLQSERMNLISSELKRLALLLNNMLNQSKHTPEVATNFDLSVLIRDLLKLTRYQVPEQIQLNSDTPVTLWVHLPESGVRQILLNLILNAVEALEEQAGTVLIKAGIESSGLFIDVLDNGRGFSQEMLECGIRPFRTSHARGTGIGLAMVQRFVKNIEGTIKLSNQIKQGACVTLSFPSYCLLEKRS
jgi:signal transduction histidine kinase